MKKILIYKNELELKPTGGPNGYLYNLKQGLQKINNKEFQFEFIQGNYAVSPIYDILLRMKKKSPKWLSNWMSKMGNRKLMKEIIHSKGESIVNLDSYCAIHFHDSFSLFKARKSLENYNGKILMTFHSPKPTYQELLDGVQYKGNRRKRIEQQLEQIDLYAFKKANYIIFPCEEAEEPYYNQWEKYKSIHEQYQKKIKYMLSGIQECHCKRSSEQIRKQYNIPENAFLISYVGRHNTIKGYDQLKQMAQILLKKYETIYFICAGVEGPIYRLEHSHWIETGWTDDPHSIIGASDLFILPNRETYFDLVLLEVLSLGKIALISKTGGNQYFENNQGIMLYQTMEEAILKVEQIMNLDSDRKKEYEASNQKLFQTHFTCETFADRYIELMGNIIR